MKRITVLQLCQVVDSDGTPVNGRGTPYGRGWEKFVDWDKRRVAISRFCPKDVARGDRTVYYDRQSPHLKVFKCACHGKWQLIGRAEGE